VGWDWMGWDPRIEAVGRLSVQPPPMVHSTLSHLKSLDKASNITAQHYPIRRLNMVEWRYVGVELGLTLLLPSVPWCIFAPHRNTGEVHEVPRSTVQINKNSDARWSDTTQIHFKTYTVFPLQRTRIGELRD
jgi:hypothetical protein